MEWGGGGRAQGVMWWMGVATTRTQGVSTVAGGGVGLGWSRVRWMGIAVNRNGDTIYVCVDSKTGKVD